jgi:hypothetical protein
MLDKLRNYLFAETLQKLANDEMTLKSREISLENEKIELKRLRAELENDFGKRRGDMFKIIEIYKDKSDKIDKEFARVLAFENEVIEKRKSDVFKNIEIKSKLENRFAEITKREKKLLDDLADFERNKVLEVKHKEVVKEEEGLIETTLRGKKILVDKYGNFKKFKNE